MIRDRTDTQEQAATLEHLLGDKHDDITRIAVRHGAYNIRFFGSVARGDAGPESDYETCKR